MRYSTLGAALLLAGCVVAKPVALPNGSTGYSINCSGRFDMGDCMNKAAEVCKGPYQMVDGNSEGAGGMMMPAGNGVMAVSAIRRTLIVSCGAH